MTQPKTESDSSTSQVRSGLRTQFSLRTFVSLATIASLVIAMNRDWLISFLEGPKNAGNVPAVFDFTPKFTRWAVPTGPSAYGSPIVDGDRIFIGTSSTILQAHQGVLTCLDRTSGDLIWQATTADHPNGRFAWPGKGQRGTPVVENDRLWYVDRQHRLVCLDVDGFRDNQDDGESCKMTEEKRVGKADVVWRFDFVGELGVTPHDSCHVNHGSSAYVAGDLLLCNTGHSNPLYLKSQQPVQAPCFVAVNKTNGKLVWSDRSASTETREPHVGQPVCARIAGVDQAIFPGGDGWLYSYSLNQIKKGKTELLWKFNCNLKGASWAGNKAPVRMPVHAQPLVVDELVYAVTGTAAPSFENQANMWCINAAKRGDVSPWVADDSDTTKMKPNPNSAMRWHYNGGSPNKKSSITLGSCRNAPAIRDGILIAADDTGFVHCLDAKTGKRFWTFDFLDEAAGSPVIVNKHIHIPHMFGITTLGFSKDPKVAMPNSQPVSVANSPNPIGATPAIANDKLYVLTEGILFAIGKAKPVKKEQK